MPHRACATFAQSVEWKPEFTAVAGDKRITEEGLPPFQRVCGESFCVQQ
jgi:hypothetical protein